jgi:hypothetical protein
MPGNRDDKGQGSRERPKFLYKYTSILSVDKILSALSLKITDPQTFNDPFDCNVPLFDLASVDMLGIIKREIGKPFGLANNVQFNALVRSLRPALERLTEEVLHMTAELSTEWDELLPQLRVLSLTTTPDNILMWSHYADYHKGVALKFDANSSIFKEARKVRYEDGDKLLSVFLNAEISSLVQTLVRGDARIDSDELSSMFSGRTLNLLFKYLLLKRREWEYEREYRVILPANSQEVIRRSDIDTVAFLPDELHEVIFGVCSDPATVGPIETLLASNFPWVKVTHAKKNGLILVL